METLFEKISTLVTSKLSDATGQMRDGIGSSAASALPVERRARNAVMELLRTEMKLHEIGGQYVRVQRAVDALMEKGSVLDRAVDDALLNGNDHVAAARQSELNALKARLRQLQVRRRVHLAERDRLLQQKDRLEARLRLMGLERKELDAVIEQFRRERSQGANAKAANKAKGQSWRVVDE